MKKRTENQPVEYIKICIWIMIIGLALSGLTAFPLQTELARLVSHSNSYPFMMSQWLQTIYGAIESTNNNYPYSSYGTDWLAFAHLLFAILSVGPLRDPVKNIWIIEFGIIACMLIVPLAFVAGSIRHIPVFWRLIDCSFGVVGFIPLFMCYKYINHLKDIKFKT